MIFSWNFLASRLSVGPLSSGMIPKSIFTNLRIASKILESYSLIQRNGSDNSYSVHKTLHDWLFDRLKLEEHAEDNISQHFNF
jgi:hypothetical protein